MTIKQRFYSPDIQLKFWRLLLDPHPMSQAQFPRIELFTNLRVSSQSFHKLDKILLGLLSFVLGLFKIVSNKGF